MNILTDEETGTLIRTAGVTDEDDGAVVARLVEAVESAVIKRLDSQALCKP